MPYSARVIWWPKWRSVRITYTETRTEHSYTPWDAMRIGTVPVEVIALAILNPNEPQYC
jgi:hypothetical protein